MTTRRVPLADRYGRPVTGLRISLNSSTRCNFGCVFCHMEGVTNGDSGEEMSPREIEHVVRLLTTWGVHKVKLTGGEPMLRRDITEIVGGLGKLDLSDLSMTTNGSRLARLADRLKRDGLDRVNVSLHSLKKEVYEQITGVDRLDETLQGIQEAIRAGLRPVKLNLVFLDGLNGGELEDMIEFSASLGGARTNVLQIIEFIPTNGALRNILHSDLAPTIQYIEKHAASTERRELHGRIVYHLDNGVAVEVVKPMHNSVFCMANTRIRITHDGKFKPCLLRNDNHVDFLGAMRSNATDQELLELYRRAVSLRAPYFLPRRLRALSKREIPKR
ncbi:MAG: GTP 3',8-cyclase MoaA, partial [Candidatus Geothermarchaeales archaeon]